MKALKPASDMSLLELVDNAIKHAEHIEAIAVGSRERHVTVDGKKVDLLVWAVGYLRGALLHARPKALQVDVARITSSDRSIPSDRG